MTGSADNVKEERGTRCKKERACWEGLKKQAYEKGLKEGIDVQRR